MMVLDKETTHDADHRDHMIAYDAQKVVVAVGYFPWQ